jgi:two-component system NtrC family sensor kinase
MPKDGCLIIRTAAETDASSNKQGICMDFSDTGPGIAEDVVNKIFDPFFTTKEKGTGLGLSAVFRIVEKHKGKVSVTSKPAEGTCFHIWLPVNPDDGEVQDA